MRAILIERGPRTYVYVLQKGEKSEVLDFFSQRDSSVAARGFRHLIEIISTQGYETLNDEQLDCWKEGDEFFCELKKGRHRIGCFFYGNHRRLLMATHFIKTVLVEKAQYRRAIKAKQRFDANPEWVESDE
jgi:hypothetical protein